MYRFTASGLSILIGGMAASSVMAGTLASSVADLTWASGGGYPTAGLNTNNFDVEGDVLEITTTRNTSLSADLSEEVVLLAPGDYLTLSFDFRFGAAIAVETAQFNFGLLDDEPTTLNGYYMSVRAFDADGNDGATFQERNGTSTSNRGRTDTDNFGTTTHSIIFTVTRMDSTTIAITLGGNLLASAASVDGAYATSAFDRVFFGFSSAGIEDIDVSISSFSLDTNVPEPASLALIAVGCAAMMGRRLA